MPRGPRVISESNIYHVMLRGIDQTQLFYDNEDREVFLDRLNQVKQKYEFELYAYSLMGNHVHLLIKEGEAKLPNIIKSLALSYSHWFNRKYDRNGYLFQGRYKSEPVGDDEYFLGVLRYIHNNPAEVGLGITEWTSHSEYLGAPQLVDTGFALSLFDANADKAKSAFDDFVKKGQASDGKDDFLDDIKRFSDAESIELICKMGGVANCGELTRKEKKERDRVLAALKDEGISIRQISRLTGINRGIVLKAGKRTEILRKG